jgi:hypothetical protein
MSMPPDATAATPALPRAPNRCAWTGSRPGNLRRRRSFSSVAAALPPVAMPTGQDPAPTGVPTGHARRCNPHRWAAREAASFNQMLDRARATPAVPRSTARLHALFHGLPTRRSAKR